MIRRYGIYVVLFAIGLSAIVRVELVGTLFLSDFLLLLAAGSALFKANSGTPWKQAMPFLTLALVWLLSAIVTDLVRGSPFENYSRGWAKIVFFMISFVGLLSLTGTKIDRLMSYFAGLSLGTIIMTTVAPNEFQAGAPWKFGYSLPVGMLTAMLASLPLKREKLGVAKPVGLLALMGLINLVLNFRSHYVILMGAAGLSGLTSFASRVAPKRRFVTPAIMFAIVAGAAIAGWGAAASYSYLAESGALGDKARVKYEMQTSGEMGLLLGGRSESLGSFQAIVDSPLLGHGSWAEDRYYAALRILKMREMGVQTQGYISSDLIPTHSYLVGAWVEAGVLGAVFWFFVLGYAVVAMFRVIDVRSTATPFIAYLIVYLLWNIPFSPFGSDVRFFVAGQLCVLIAVMRNYKKVGERFSAPASRPHF